MKSNANSKLIILITLGILFVLLPVISINLSVITSNSNKVSDYSDDSNLDTKNPKISAVSGKIHIDNNWTAANGAGICTGNGTYTDPYIIEDLVIDGEGSGSCIWIENSDVYFKIENCTVYNSEDFPPPPSIKVFISGGWIHPTAGIKLSNVSNSKLINNTCSSNWNGIYLENCRNHTISGNIANDNRHDGISLSESNNNTVSENIANDNKKDGISLSHSYNIIMSGNIMNECGVYITGSLYDTFALSSHKIDTTNLVNGKSLYYYNNKTNLGSKNFSDAGQVILVNCDNSLISNLNVSHCAIGIFLWFCNNNRVSKNILNVNKNDGIWLISCNNNNISGNIANDNDGNGISLFYCNNNTVSGNTANYNWCGIHLSYSNTNIISGNKLIGNDNCISELYCEGNIFENNDCGNEQPIPGYNLFFLLGILSFVAIVISKKVKKS